MVLAIRGGHSVTITKVNSDHQVATAEVSARKSASIVHPRTWSYTNPLKAVSGLEPGRIDMGADFAGSGPVLALGNGKVTMASDHDLGPPSCWGRTCWPVGGILVYRLSDGPLADRYVYVAENISVTVTAGQSVRTGQKIATMHDAFPYIETGWASGKGAETLAIADRHQCPCGDPGGWSTIEGRNFASVLLVLGAPAERLQPDVPAQHMPSGWPMWPASAGARSFPRSSTPLSEGATKP